MSRTHKHQATYDYLHKNRPVAGRIKKFQSKEEIIITESQLMSSECIYDDEAKEY